MNKSFINIISILFISLYGFSACSHEEIDSYSADRCLYFIRYQKNSEGKNVHVDSVSVSFSHYYGVTEYTQPFYVGLIGDLLTEDKEYRIEVVEKGSTVSPGQYSLPEKLIFHKGCVMDTLPITIYKDKMKEDEECKLILRIMPNENFKVGYSAVGDSYRNIIFCFNNKISKPLWWNSDIDAVFFGTYSYEKLETIFKACPDFTTADGLTSTELRIVALKVKKYIEDNGITEKDGEPMEIPMY